MKLIAYTPKACTFTALHSDIGWFMTVFGELHKLIDALDSAMRERRAQRLRHEQAVAALRRLLHSHPDTPTGPVPPAPRTATARSPRTSTGCTTPVARQHLRTTAAPMTTATTTPPTTSPAQHHTTGPARDAWCLHDELTAPPHDTRHPAAEPVLAILLWLPHNNTDTTTARR